MVNKYHVVIVEADENNDKEIGRTVDVLIKSVQAQRGTARIAYQGNKKEIIDTINSMLDMEKLSK